MDNSVHSSLTDDLKSSSQSNKADVANKEASCSNVKQGTDNAKLYADVAKRGPAKSAHTESSRGQSRPVCQRKASKKVFKKATRATQHAAAVGRSLLNAISQAKGEHDADMEMRHEHSRKSAKCDKDGDDDAEGGNAPHHLNPISSQSSPRVLDDRPFFCPMKAIPRWPAILMYIFPYLCCVSGCLSMSVRRFVLLLLVVSAAQSSFMILWSHIVLSRFWVKWLKRQVLRRLPPIATVDDACEIVHTLPEIVFFSWCWRSFIMFLQSVTWMCCPVSYGISGYAFHMFTEFERVTFEDVRLANQQANSFAPEIVSYDVYACASFDTGVVSYRVVCEELARQIEPRLITLSVEDRKLQAVSMCTRVSNLMISGRRFPEVSRGSADLALQYCTAQDASSGVYASCRSFSSLTRDVITNLAVVVVCLVLFPFAKIPGDVTVAVLQSYCVVAFTSVVISPILEEGIKSAVGSWTGGGRPVGALLFGAFELGLNCLFPSTGESLWSYIPPFVMHLVSGYLSFWQGFALHTLYNLLVCFVKLWIMFTVVFSSVQNPDFGKPFDRSSPGSVPAHEPDGVCVFDPEVYAVSPIQPPPELFVPISALQPHMEVLDSFAFCCEMFHLSDPHKQGSHAPRFYKLDSCPTNFENDHDALGVFDGQGKLHVYKHHIDGIECVKYADKFSLCPASVGMWLPIVVLSCVGLVSIFRESHFRVVKISRVEPDDRLFCAGYRLNEVHLPPSGAHGAKIKFLPSFFLPSPRRSLSSTLGFAFKMFAPCVPDFYHPLTALHGCLCRFCKDPPAPKPGMLRRLRRFTQRYVKTHYDPIPVTADVSIETWLASTTYPEWRKDELRRCWVEPDETLEEDFYCKSFIKQESYGRFKPARGINSRSDRFKVFSGPFFKLMEKQVYHQGCLDSSGRFCEGDMCPFIKHIPVPDRPLFMSRYFEGCSGPFYETDYSQFEKHFLPEVMHSLELILYKHMLKNFPKVACVLEDALAGQNVCKYKSFVLRVLGRRMSGDMCTSLGNGFSNLMLFSFACFLKGGVCKGIVEGDDGLFVSTVPLAASDFTDLGFDIKIAVFTQANEASFCGMLMSSDGCLMRDPQRVIPKFGWSFSPRRNGKKRVRDRLLVAKALSLAYESPRCPLVWALAKSVLRKFGHIAPLFDRAYEQIEVQAWCAKYGTEDLEARLIGPSLQCRVEFAEKFGISVPLQQRIESVLEQWDGSTSCDKLLESVFLDAGDMFSFASEFVFTSEKMVGGLCDCLSS